jgi:hypothetical protein
MEISSRQHTVLPAHGDVAPDDLSDEQVITQHLVQPAVPNAANDTEYTSGGGADYIAPQKAPRIALMISISASLLVLAALLIYVVLVFA